MREEAIATCNTSNSMTERRSYVASIDQGTSSSRCIVFDQNGNIVSEFQMEHEQFYPQPGFVEHDAEEIWVCPCSLSKCSSKPQCIMTNSIVGVFVRINIRKEYSPSPVYECCSWGCWSPLSYLSLIHI